MSYPDEDTREKRISAAVETCVNGLEGMSFGDMFDVWGLVLHKVFGASMSHLMNTEQLRLLRDLHHKLINGAPASEDLVKAARAVVAARHSGGEWEELKDAIGELEGLVGRATLTTRTEGNRE